MSGAEALARLGARPEGLSAAEAAERLARHGANRLPEPPRPGPLRRFAAQFGSLLVQVLLGAAVVALLLGHPLDAVVILLVVLANAAIGFVQEGRAERALAAIQGLLAPRAAVLREGRRISLDAADLVPGDIVLLEAGDRVPADLRLLDAPGLRVDEAALTGESVPVSKTAEAAAPDAPLAARPGMAYAGTLAAAGAGRGVVVATGADTELGRIGALVAGVGETKTPLLRRLDAFGTRLTFAILGASAVVFLLAWALRGWAAGEAFLAVIGLAVAAIPEGLPAVITITLALGVRRMAERRALTRRLPAVEALGAVTVICSDKTGTLTRGEMSALEAVTPAGVWAAEGEGYAPEGRVAPRAPGADPGALAALARAALLCNDAALRPGPDGWRAEGDPMEAALLAFAARAGLDEALAARHPRLAAEPFDAATRRMATLHATPEGGGLLCVKGAPEAVLPLCPGADRARWEAEVARLSGEGLRVLAFAEAEAAPEPAALPAALAGGLRFLGLVALLDPPRAEAQAAVAECRAAGIRVKMITGDHPATAAAIARRLGIPGAERVMTGAEVAALDEAALAAAAPEVAVFARAAPEDKIRLVAALQARGEIVAMTGDGVNDAPALKRADVGVAMGRGGTEAARQAAAMVLTDDNFASIVAAVREGRTVGDNIAKVIAWTLPTNIGEALCVVGAVLLGLSLPVSAAQLLWINTVTAVALGLTLAFEPAERGVMARPPQRPDAPILPAATVRRMLLVGVLIAAIAFAGFEAALAAGEPAEQARTMAVNLIVGLEIAYLFTVRGAGERAFSPAPLAGTRAVWAGVGLVVLLQLAFTYAPPFQALFRTAPMGLLDWAMVLGAMGGFWAAMEAVKAPGGRWRFARAARRSSMAGPNGGERP
jgi:magnesium-transporting ATPase (P-type)